MNTHAAIPRASDIDPAWLHEHLGWPLDAAPIQVEPLSRTGGQMGPVHRIRWGARSLIYKTTPDSDTEWGRWALQAGVLAREVSLYRMLREHNGAPRGIAPRCYWSALRPDGHGALALEDLGAAGTVTGSAMARGLTDLQARAAVRTLALLHSLSATTTPTGEPHEWLLNAQSPPLLDSIRMGLDDIDGPSPLWVTPWEPTAAQQLSQIDVARTSHRAHAQATLQAVCHGDAWASNIVFLDPARLPGTPSAYLIDWQFAMWGNPLADVALLLLSSLDPASRRAWEGRLLHHYHHVLTSTVSLDYTLAQCRSDYRRALPYVALVALATLDGFTAGMTRTERFRFAPRAATAMNLLAANAEPPESIQPHEPSNIPTRSTMPHTVEIAVIGAGMFGAAAAKYLSREGADVLVIGPAEPGADEALSQHSFGAHYDQARICRRIGWDPVWAALDSRSLERFRDIEADSGLRFFHDCGSLILMAGSLHTRTSAMVQRGREEGIDVAWLAQSQLRTEFPELGIPELDGGTEGLLERAHAGYLNPRALVTAQLRLAAAAGGRCVRAPVVAMDRRKGLWRLQILDGTTRREIAAEKVLMATGAFTNHNGLLPAGVRLGMRAFTEPNLLFALDEHQRDRFASLPPVVVVDPADIGDDNMSLYLLPPVQYPDRRWYLRIGPGMQPFIDPLSTVEEMTAWYTQQTITRRQRRFLSTAMRTMVPGLGSTLITQAGCIIEKTLTRYPYIGYLDDSLAVAVGGNGHGARGSDEIGRLAAMLLLGKPWDSAIAANTFTPVLDPDDSRCSQLATLKPPFGLC
ncbi:FAD-dependent oxidoreductase [Nocardia altamirensis]|uniref:FAD-dependent oxidoreductase n=1 Tax=Nocardia altamirensis TaxID=472158 RepID=UPI000840603E|nr:FAD-dependent oxidoreductase [Nocardia altamirensis]